MPHSRQYLRTKDNYCLINLESVESLDVCVHGVNKVTRLWTNNFVHCPRTARLGPVLRIQRRFFHVRPPRQRECQFNS